MADYNFDDYNIKDDFTCDFSVFVLPGDENKDDGEIRFTLSLVKMVELRVGFLGITIPLRWRCPEEGAVVENTGNTKPSLTAKVATPIVPT